MKHRLLRLAPKLPLKKGLLFALVGLVLAPGLLMLAQPQSVSALSANQIMKDALDACNTSDSHNECVTGYINGYNGQSSQAVCTQWVGTPNYNPCVRGINLGRAAANNAPVDPPVPTNDPSTPSKAAQSFCAGKTGKAASGCSDGYDGQTSGKSKQDACKGYSGNPLTVCQNAWDQSQTDAQNANANNNSPPTCESGGFDLSWIFCPVIEGLASAVDGIYSGLIQPLLQVKPVDISNSSGDPTHAFAIWSQFRVYGDVLLVIALMVVVFGESIGGGVIDAYTAKKILPRLLVAAVLINISIFIVAFAVDITNIVGNGVAALIQAPFHTAACASQSKSFSNGSGCFALNISGSAADVGGLGIIGLVGSGAASIWALAATSGAISVGAGAAAVAGGITGILWPLLEFLLIMVLIPALLTFVAILATLLFRQGLILFLLLISPIAFALYCLPNTEQYFRKWWDLLFKTLLIYPLIAVIFALANVLSVTIDSTTTGIAKPFADLLSIMALLAPLFLIPFSFKIAGGVIGQISEFANNTKQRAHGGIIGSERDPDSWRNRTRSKLRQGRRETGLDSRIIGDSFKAVPGSQQWRQNWQSRRAASRTLEGQQFLEHDAVALANKGNDQYYLAGANPDLAQQMRDGDAAEAAEAAARGDTAAAMSKEAAVRSWDQSIGYANLMPKTPANRQAMAIEHAKTGFQYAAGQEGYDQMAETAAGITGAPLVRDEAGHVTGASGPRAGAYGDLMDSMQFNEKQAGRFEFAGINRGAGYTPESGWDKASGYTGGNSKPETFKAGAEHFLGADLKAGDNDDSNRLASRLAGNITSGRTSVAQVAEWHSKLLDAKGSATGANKKEINKQLEAIEGVANSTPNDDAHLDTHIQLADAVRRNRLEQRRSIDPNEVDNE